MSSWYLDAGPRRGAVLCCIVLSWFLPQLASTCSSKCWNVLSKPNGKKGAYGNKFSIPISPDKTVTGVITVNGTFYSDIVVPYVPQDTIHFTVLEPENRYWIVKPLMITYGFSTDDGRSYAQVKCARNSSGSRPTVEGDTRPIYNDHVKDVDSGDTMFSGNVVNIQVSDLAVSSRHSYLLYLGKPGRARKVEYNYNSRKLWDSDDYSSNRLNATSTVSNSDNYGFYVYNSITVCTDPQPVLCDDKSNVTIEASLGRTYTLSCGASGAPYLGARWERNGAIVEDHQEKIGIAENGADTVIESTLQIPAFTTDHIGVYTCIVFNKNFENTVEKSFTLRYSHEISLQVPCSDTFTNEDEGSRFTWTVEGWPLDNIKLTCLPDVYLNINTNILSHYSPPRLRVELQFDVKSVPGEIRCDLLNGRKVLDNRTISRVGYKCTDEQFGVGKECYSKFSPKQAICWLYPILAFVGYIMGVLQTLVLQTLYFKCYKIKQKFK